VTVIATWWSITEHGVVSRILYRGYGRDTAPGRSIRPFDRVYCSLERSCCESTAGVDGAPLSTSQPSNGGTKRLQSEHVGFNLHEYNHDDMLKDQGCSCGQITPYASWGTDAQTANTIPYIPKKITWYNLCCSNPIITAKSFI
jgi:hypothetical protein